MSTKNDFTPTRKLKKSAKLDYVFSLINLEGYETMGYDNMTRKDILSEWGKIIYSEVYAHPNKTNQESIGEWLQGLPSSFNLEFMNYKILELIRSWGYLLDTEKKEDSVLENYWLNMAGLIIQLFDANGLRIILKRN